MGWSRRLTYTATAACFVATAFLVAGTDFSLLTRAPAQPLVAAAGDTVVLDVKGTLDNGTTFLDDRHLSAELGNGTLVAGLENVLEGMQAGKPFAVTVPPAQGYGAVDATRVSFQARNENVSRIWQVPYDEFQAQLGPPSVGQVVHGRVLDSVVVSTGDPVVLRYQLAMAQTLHVYSYWLSRVTALDNSTIFFENLLHRGDQFTLGGQGPPVVVRVTTESTAGFTLDSNPALAGLTLHFSGTLLSIRPGTGARHLAGMAVSLGSESCETCHGGAGFTALAAQGSATVSGDTTLVNVTIADPWLHEVQGIDVTGTLGNGTRVAGPRPGDLASQGSEQVQLTLPAGKGSVHLVINATAHHTHQSGGKPDSLPYQLTLDVPIGAPRTALPLPASSVAVEQTLGITGRLTGLAALGVLLAAAVQGYRRHKRKKPLVRLAPWLTTHLAFSLVTIAITLVHAEALMSGSWHGNWSWGVTLGAIALVLLGFMGLTGIGLAGWTKWPRFRRIHFYLMMSVLVLTLVHTWAVGTDVKFLR
ncbi:MAG: FKBP-type peptidyl-prolyl cis-trans isomerase [Thermoplasmatota archaeon]